MPIGLPDVWLYLDWNSNSAQVVTELSSSRSDGLEINFKFDFDLQQLSKWTRWPRQSGGTTFRGQRTDRNQAKRTEWTNECLYCQVVVFIGFRSFNNLYLFLDLTPILNERASEFFIFFISMLPTQSRYSWTMKTLKRRLMNERNRHSQAQPKEKLCKIKSRVTVITLIVFAESVPLGVAREL